MGFKTGLVSVSFRQNTPKEILDAMRGAGLKYVEWGSDVHAPKDDIKRIYELAELQKQYKVRCCSYGTYFTVGVTPTEDLVDYIRAARILGTDIIRIWAGKGREYSSYSAKEKEEFIEICKKCAEIAEKEAVTLCLECHKGTFTDCKEGALELIKRVNSEHFKMYWQPNQNKAEAENMAYAELLAPYTEHIHVFNWKEKEKKPLAEAMDIWKKYLEILGGEHYLLLEFMPDGRIESLPAEADALRRIIE